MTIEENIKKRLKHPSMQNRGLYQLIIGEFSRINDGKPITDEQAIKVIKKMVKSNETTMQYSMQNDIKWIELNYENAVLINLLPVEKNLATDEQMFLVIKEILVKHDYKNPMQGMKDCITCLEQLDLTVDKNRLSQLLKGL